MRRTWRDLSDEGWTTKPWKKPKGLKKKRQRFATKEDAEEDRKWRTGVRVKRKGSLNNG